MRSGTRRGAHFNPVVTLAFWLKGLFPVVLMPGVLAGAGQRSLGCLAVSQGYVRVGRRRRGFDSPYRRRDGGRPRGDPDAPSRHRDPGHGRSSQDHRTGGRAGRRRDHRAVRSDRASPRWRLHEPGAFARAGGRHRPAGGPVGLRRRPRRGGCARRPAHRVPARPYGPGPEIPGGCPGRRLRRSQAQNRGPAVSPRVQGLVRWPVRLGGLFGLGGLDGLVERRRLGCPGAYRVLDRLLIVGLGELLVQVRRLPPRGVGSCGLKPAVRSAPPLQCFRRDRSIWHSPSCPFPRGQAESIDASGPSSQTRRSRRPTMANAWVTASNSSGGMARTCGTCRELSGTTTSVAGRSRSMSNWMRRRPSNGVSMSTRWSLTTAKRRSVTATKASTCARRDLQLLIRFENSSDLIVCGGFVVGHGCHPFARPMPMARSNHRTRGMADASTGFPRLIAATSRVRRESGSTQAPSMQRNCYGQAIVCAPGLARAVRRFQARGEGYAERHAQEYAPECGAQGDRDGRPPEVPGGTRSDPRCPWRTAGWSPDRGRWERRQARSRAPRCPDRRARGEGWLAIDGTRPRWRPVVP